MMTEACDATNCTVMEVGEAISCMQLLTIVQPSSAFSDRGPFLPNKNWLLRTTYSCL